jgi:uncharacterized protein (TIGR03435 family)
MVQGVAPKVRCGSKPLGRMPHSVVSLLSFACALLLASFAPAGSRAQQPTLATSAKLPTFEVATVKPSKPGRWGEDLDESNNRLTIQNYSLRHLIREAFRLKSDSQIIGGPGWIDNQRFDIVAKVDDGEVARMDKMDGDESDREWDRMLQSLLADRFQLKVTRGQRTLPVFALVVTRSGPKMKPKRRKTSDAPSDSDPGIDIRNGELTARSASMDAFADGLTGMRDMANRVVINRTGLAGSYDFQLDWARDRGDGASQDSPYPGLFTALPEQLGLKLKSSRASIAVVIVNLATLPSVN